MRHTLSKAERLCSRKLIEELFQSGNSFFCYPFRIIWSVTCRELPYPAQMAPAVPSRNFKKAVTRNLLRRRIKEAYRKNKEIIYQPLEKKGIKIIFMIQYTGKEVKEYDTIQKAVKDALGKLAIAVCGS
jgi:ribonuclease P protein component